MGVEQEGLALMCEKPNKRPVITEALALEAARLIAVDLLKTGAFDPADTPDDLAGDIVKAAAWDWSMDGYALARNLEQRCGWTPDASMVEELDGFSMVCDRLLSEAEKQWAVENPMEPPFPIGTVIKHHWGAGEISEINKYKPFTYCVVIPTKPGSFAIVKFEDAVAT